MLEIEMLSFISVVFLALIHLFGHRIRFLAGTPRNHWLSFAGGVTIAYIFVHLLPELGMKQKEFLETESFLTRYLEYHLYLVALIGLAIFFGLERETKLSAITKTNEKSPENNKQYAIFYLHIAFFALYNFFVGCTFDHRAEKTWQSMLLYTVAIGFHFLVNDFGLYEHYRAAYQKTGRWILTAAVLLGWGMSRMMEIPMTVLAIIFAFISGATIMNVLKEELPAYRKSKYWAFIGGILFYSVLLILME